MNADGATLRGNEITNDHSAICVSVNNYSSEPPPRGVVIENNVIHDCGLLPATNHQHGIYVANARDTVDQRQRDLRQRRPRRPALPRRRRLGRDRQHHRRQRAGSDLRRWPELLLRRQPRRQQRHHRLEHPLERPVALAGTGRLRQRRPRQLRLDHERGLHGLATWQRDRAGDRRCARLRQRRRRSRLRRPCRRGLPDQLESPCADVFGRRPSQLRR